MVLQREIRQSLDSESYQRDQHLVSLGLEIHRVDSLEGFRSVWSKLRAILGVAGQSTARRNANVLGSVGVVRPLPTERVLIEAFQNSTIGYARTILRDQLLKARELLDTPNATMDRIRQREEILKTFDAYENRMRRMATNELLQLNADLNKSRQMTAGIQQYVWTTCLDDRVRPSHQALEGSIQSWLSPPMPGYHPGEDFNCRCCAVPVLDDTYMLVRNQAFV